MSSTYEGDLLRPLGLLTLYFGYAEAQVNSLIAMLRETGVVVSVPATAPLGQRLSEFATTIRRLTGPGVGEIIRLLEESTDLLEKRNALVHSAILAKGRVVPNDPAKPDFSITPAQLTALAERAFDWKERLNAAVQLRLLPALRQDTISRA